MENNISDHLGSKEIGLDRIDGLNVKHETAQPVIIGNVNAASLFASSIGGAENSMLIPPNMMGLPVTVNNNQVIGILPVFIQGSHMPCNNKLVPTTTNSFESVQVMHSNSSIGNGSKENVDSNMITYPSVQFTSGSTSAEQTKLTSSDTVILSSSASTLTSMETLPLFKSSETNVNEPTTHNLGSQLQQKPSTSTLQTAFSLISSLSNRSIALESIPTSSLFTAPDQTEVLGINDPPPREASQNETSSSLNNFQPTASFMVKNDMSMRSHQGPNKPVRERNSASESDTNRLQIDEATNEENDTEDTFSKGNQKQSSLTRDETLILHNSSLPSQSQNQSSLTASDTLILSNNDSQMVTNTSSKQIVTDCSRGLFNSDVSMTESGIIMQASKPSFSSIPSLMLTDSIVDGTSNPTFLYDLISQPSESSFPPIRYLTFDQFLSCANSNVIASMQKSLQGSSVSLLSQSSSSNLSVKGTQTDWILGNASVQFKPIKVPEINGNEEKVVDGNIPSLLLGNDVVNVPFVAEDQQLSTSVLNIVPQNQPVLRTEMAPKDSTMDKSNEVEETTDGGLPFQCTTCEEEFSSKQQLLKHEITHKKVLKCDLCTSTFTRMGNYKRHRKIHNLKPESQNVFTCTQCGREFLQRCDLKRHMFIHTNQYPYHCEKCGKGYIRRSDLVVHMRFHNKEKVFNCTLCEKSYFQSGDLSRHVRRAHKPHTELTCGHCNRKYACETTLIRHMKVVHKDIILNTVGQGNQEPG